jgi:hypothetical protein
LIRDPVSALAGAPTPSQARLRAAGVIILILGVTFGQRLCVPMGTMQLPIVALLAYVSLGLFIISGLARIDAIGFILYGVAIMAMVATFMAPKLWFSVFSFAYLAGLYFIFLFSVDVDRETYRRYLLVYQRVMMVMAGIALLQFAEQLTTHTRLSLFDHVPNGFWIEGYNTRPTLGWGNDFRKSNGEFFLEPSFLSQFLAVAVIIELLFFGNWRRIALYGAGIFCSFSGTGMLLLVLFGAATVIKARRYEFLYALPLLLLAFLLLQDNPYVMAITGRVSEFGAEGSSASIRFDAPNEALLDLVNRDFVGFLIGRGPGVVDQLGKIYGFGESNYPALHKLLIEYGLVGTVPFLVFLCWRFFAWPRSRILAGALFVMYMVLSGSLLQPHTIFLAYVLVIALPLSSEEAALKQARRLGLAPPEGLPAFGAPAR